MESHLTDDFFDFRHLGERVDLELKMAQGRDGKGQLPKSFWETYSAMANSQGGLIVLGVTQHADAFRVTGVPDHEKVIQDLWNQANNRQVVSANLLTEKGVYVRDYPDGKLIFVHVPQAGRKHRPVYITENPLTGTYRRNNEGDYHCPKEVVQQMLGEQLNDTRDGSVLDGFTFDDIHLDTLRVYRQHFANRQPTHVLNDLDNLEFLRQLGGWARDRQSAKEGPTLAGLLMFGKLRSILDAAPHYIVDYQERPRAVTENRWIDRETTDFSWSGNLYDFYRRVYAKLINGLKVPFGLRGDERVPDSPVHEAIREALVNTLIHADYSGTCSILVVKRPDLFGFRNPGLLRVPIKDAIHGGVSDCRNRNLQKMFQLVGLGEQSGFGFPKIYNNWSQLHWRSPDLEERIEGNQTILALRMTSLLPPEAVDTLRRRFGPKIDQLTNPERIALVTAYAESCVTHDRMKELTQEHPRDLSQLLHGLVDKELLESDGKGKATFYFLPGEHPIRPSGAGSVFGLEGASPSSGHLLTSSEHLSPSSEHLPPSSEHLPPSPDHLNPDSEHFQITAVAWAQLLAQAAAIRETGKIDRETMVQMILTLTQKRFLTLVQLATLLGRGNDTLRNHYVTPMLDAGFLRPEFPNIKSHPKQRYTATESASPAPAAS